VRTRAPGALIGIVFGLILCWSAVTSPEVIRSALLFEESYLFLLFGSAVVTATVGQRVLRRVQARAALTGAPLTWTPDRPERRHVVGALLFGAGWGIADACPGPIATHVGQGIWWSLFTMAGVIAGVYLFLRRSRVETEPAVDRSGSATAPLTARPEPAGTR
jgi:uncharacterized membrane protein YedE/YeeE